MEIASETPIKIVVKNVISIMEYSTLEFLNSERINNEVDAAATKRARKYVEGTSEQKQKLHVIIYSQLFTCGCCLRLRKRVWNRQGTSIPSMPYWCVSSTFVEFESSRNVYNNMTVIMLSYASACIWLVSSIL